MKKLLALGLTIVMALSCVGCSDTTSGKGGQSDYNGGKKVEVKYWNSGMGLEYMENLVSAFNQKQSDWYVTFQASASSDALTTAYGIESADTTDLYIVGSVKNTAYMESLDELLESTADGDSKPLKDKFDADYLESEREADGHIYTLTNGGGVLGIVYNQKLFDKAGITQIPRTTDELAVACDKLLNAGITPMAHFQWGGYWSYFWEAWRAQYDGMEYYRNFYAGIDANGGNDYKSLLTTKDGRYQVLKVLEKIITPEYILNGSNSMDHTTMQTMFLNSDIGMMVNGAWLANEMASVGSMDDYGVMKTPVISSIIEKLQTVKSDAELRNLISAIDSVNDGEADISEYQSGDGYVIKEKTVSAEDWEYVQAARLTVATCYNGQSNFIPTYSDAKEGAMDFLKFYYSDEGYQIYVDATHVKLPLTLSEGTLDESEWNTFEVQVNELLDRAKYYATSSTREVHRIFSAGGAPTGIDMNWVARFCSNNVADRVTAEDVWKDMMNKVDSNYDKWLANIK